METEQLTFGSLFAGIGGFDLGFERAGMQCLWQVEKDPFCQKVLAKHWPNVERFEDVRNVGKHNLQPVDVICGGFPCQPHSLAGKRRGAADDRNLWPEYRRIVAELRPAYVVGENVPGIKSTILDQVLSDLEDLDYTTATFVIPACAVDAPHRRDRVWIVAYSEGCDAGKPTEWQGRQDFVGRGVDYRGNTGAGKKVMADVNQNTNGQRQQKLNPAAVTNGTGQYTGSFVEAGRAEWWATEPGVGRVANGVPNRLDRLKSLGNAVVPQLAEFIATLVIRAYNKSLERNY